MDTFFEQEYLQENYEKILIKILFLK